MGISDFARWPTSRLYRSCYKNKYLSGLRQASNNGGFMGIFHQTSLKLTLVNRPMQEQIRDRRRVMTKTEASEQLAADTKALVRDAEELLKATAGEAGEKFKEVRHRLSKALESIKTTSAYLQDKTIQTAKAADETIREHPYESIGVAFGVGALIGFLVGRR
jgi:ElaB/YqjD/DUF883 family membrane-anchored ribosome-binding protein